MPTTTPGGRRRRVAPAAFGLLAATGLALLGWAFTNQADDPPAPSRDAARELSQPSPTGTQPPPAAPASGGTSESPSSTTPAGTAAPSRGPAATPAAGQPASGISAPRPLPASTPVRVRIPAIEVSSPLHALGLAEDGTLQVPGGDRYDEAAWYDGSPTPGEVGGAVIEGHVTSQGSVPSVFFDLGALGRGDRVHVDREDGTTATFQVYGVESFPKDAFPKVAVYGNTEGPELRIITCGGVYDPDQRRHLDNIVVFARMVTSS